MTVRSKMDRMYFIISTYIGSLFGSRERAKKKNRKTENIKYRKHKKLIAFLEEEMR
jgi:hypothetical protein